MSEITRVFRAVAVLAVVVSQVGVVGAARAQNGEAAADYTAHPDTPSVTYHVTEINGEEIHYLATAGTTTMVDRKLEPAAKMFHISYRMVTPLQPEVAGPALEHYITSVIEDEETPFEDIRKLNRWIEETLSSFVNSEEGEAHFEARAEQARAFDEQFADQFQLPDEAREEMAEQRAQRAGQFEHQFRESPTRFEVLSVSLDQDCITLLFAHGMPAEALFEFPDPTTRPVSFSFNGGPGSSSVWLHMGVFGPKRVKHADDFGNPGPPPHELVTNEYSLLDRTDWVFIDPISTGYSRAEEGTSEKDFHGLENDIRSVGEFIRRWVGDHGRWGSPKFVAGESYGTTRAAGLSRYLTGNLGMSLNGVVLVSAVTNFQTIRFNVGNDDPHLLYLPSFAATARFHGRLNDRLTNMPMDEFIDEVELFTLNEYAPALLRGDTLPADELDRIAERLSEYCGVSAEYAKDVHLRFDVPRFNKELRRDEGLTVGRLDSRYTGRDRDDGGDGYEYDPAMNAIDAIYTGTFNQYVREDLGYDSDLNYEILTGVYPWSYGGAGDNRYANVSERLRSAMHRVPEMRVFIASGYYDLATPYFATDYTTSHMFVDPELRDNIETHYYESGHMMYVHLPSLAKLREDLDGFYDRALGN